MMTEVNLFEEFAICSVDELRDKKIRMSCKSDEDKSLTSYVLNGYGSR